MNNNSIVYIYKCDNCGEEYHFYEKLIELRCESCGSMVVEID